MAKAKTAPRKLLLIDGNSLVYRAFFALPTDMATASGQVTNAVFGFTSMLINLLKDHQPDAICVTFDRPEPTFRHEMLTDYKAGRAEAPDILRQQMGLTRQVVETLKIPIVEMAGFEADDCIATLATCGRDQGWDVIVVTGDRDTYQLVEDPHVKVLYNRRGVSDYVLYDEAGILERTGVRPVDYPQYAALRGDPSDNLPGVPGVGEKKAAKLINTYGDLDGIFAHLDELSPKLRQNLADAEDQVRSNAKATPLVRDLAIAVDIETLRMGEFDAEAVTSLFGFLEFRTLYDRLIDALGDAASTGAAAVAEVSGTLDVDVRVARSADEVVAALRGGESVALAADTPLTGLALAIDDDTALWVPADLLRERAVADALNAVAAFDAHRAKDLMRALDAYGVDLRNLRLDTALAAYLIDPAGNEYVLDDLAIRHLGLELRSPDAPPPDQLDLDGTAGTAFEDTGRRAVAIRRLVPPLSEALSARGLSALYDDVERPLVRVLAKMEEVGIRVDVDKLRELAGGWVDQCRKLERQIQDDAGEEFTVNSTVQLRHILFEKLGLAPQKKTKTGYSTDAASLEKLRGEHPIIDHLLEYREVEKLRSTYGDALLSSIAGDGRIHATFQQTVARTGRLSSDNPNLHNIPIRTDEGRRIRECFVPEPGWKFLVADYNQIELRVIAHLAEDPGLVEAFTTGADIHNATAARIFGVAPADVTVGQRSKAKMVSYGLAYGMEAYGLGQRLGIPTDEAAEILNAYFEGFPKVKAYMEQVVAEARDRGYTETLFGRRRQIPELSSSNFRIRQAGERQAMNAGIQGLAADIFKVALVQLDAALESGGHRSRLVLQVHDEVILEVPPDEVDAVGALTLDTMRGACVLNVPLEVNLSWGDSWADAKG
jgi:DNA polymerase-1